MKQWGRKRIGCVSSIPDGVSYEFDGDTSAENPQCIPGNEQGS
jgi:hypothetical protein